MIQFSGDQSKQCGKCRMMKLSYFINAQYSFPSCSRMIDYPLGLLSCN